MSTLERKPKSWVPCPASKPMRASRGPASRLKTWIRRYSTPRPESVGVIGRSLNMRMSAHRLATSASESPGGGSGEPEERATIRAAFGLVASSGAVIPASFSTLTRKTVQPCCTSFLATGPAVAFTRLSGLISTVTRQRGSRAAWMALTASSSSATARAAVRAAADSAGSGWPREVSASPMRAACAASGCLATVAPRAACAESRLPVSSVSAMSQAG